MDSDSVTAIVTGAVIVGLFTGWKGAAVIAAFGAVLAIAQAFS